MRRGVVYSRGFYEDGSTGLEFAEIPPGEDG